MIQFPVIIFELVVRNVRNDLYFQIGIFNVKITENSVIHPFFLNFPLLIWIKSLIIYDDLIRILFKKIFLIELGIQLKKRK